MTQRLTMVAAKNRQMFSTKEHASTDGMVLSILVCGVHTRYNTFLPQIQKQLFDQYNALNVADQNRVEIIVLTDNKKQVLGHKRNLLVDMAQGKYVQFVDDDDRVSTDFLSSLLEATKSNADSIVFENLVTTNGRNPKKCYYSKDHKKDYNTDDAYYRIPNHISCVKRDIAVQCRFPSVTFAEDTAYATQLLPKLKTEYKINKVLYYYDYNTETTETQKISKKVNKPTTTTAKNRNAKETSITPLVDVVVLSKATNAETQAMTQHTVNSCIRGAGNRELSVTVIENGKPTKYKNCTTVLRTVPFNFNEYANHGFSLGKAEWLVLANNDLNFTEGWLDALLSTNYPVVSPKEPRDSRQRVITKNTKGYENGKHFSGWCFLMRRDVWEKMRGFDTDVDFWCSDDAVIEQLKDLKIPPMIVPSSIVEHLGSKTLKALPSAEQKERQWRNVYIFNQKYNKSKFIDNPEYLSWLKENM